MKVSLRKTGPVIALAILIVAVVVGGYMVVHNRAHGSGTAAPVTFAAGPLDGGQGDQDGGRLYEALRVG
jgi:hypothetical protein